MLAGMPTKLDADSARWLEELRSQGPLRALAHSRLHAILLRMARAEAFRRRDALPPDVAGDLDDLCLQAANDAVVAILSKLDAFRGESSFTTWACKFALLEVSVRLRRRAWSRRRVALEEASWERLVDPAHGPERSVEHNELLSAVRQLVQSTLTEHQRRVFLAVVAEEIPIDVIAERTGSSRGAVYKTLHDARRRLRAAISVVGHREAK